MNNKEEGIRQAAYKETVEASTQEKVLSENETAALDKLQKRYGEEEGATV